MSVLPVPPLGPRTVIISPSARRGTLPRRRASAFSSANAELRCRLRQRDQVVCAGLERLLEETVRRAAVEHHDRPSVRWAVAAEISWSASSCACAAADDHQVGRLLEPAAGASRASSSDTGANRRAGRQRLPERLGVEAVLERDEDPQPLDAHLRPPTDRRTFTGGHRATRSRP